MTKRIRFPSIKCEPRRKELQEASSLVKRWRISKFEVGMTYRRISVPMEYTIFWGVKGALHAQIGIVPFES